MRMGGTSRRGHTCVTVLAAIFLSMSASLALAQGGALPADVAQALDAAIAAGSSAADNAAISAAIARAPSHDDVAARTQLRISETAITEAVVSGIARHPGSTSAIVGAAIQRAPGFRDAIVHRSGIAFPAFTNEIAAGAGMAPPPVPPAYTPQPSYAALATYAPASGYTASPVPPAYTPQPSYAALAIYAPASGYTASPAYAPAPVYAPAPSYTQTQGYVTYDQPTVIAGSDQATTAPGETAMRSEATAPGRAGPWFGISEVRLGVHHHDAGIFGRNKEDGVDVSVEVRLVRFTGGFWDTIWQPRAHLGVNINSEGDTSSAHTGLTWDWQIWGPFFGSFELGGAVHDGETSTSALDRKELGSRVLFREALEIGYRFEGHHALSLRFDHMSNASLADNNEGLGTVGVVYGYSF